jgi:hypothetical protein
MIHEGRLKSKEGITFPACISNSQIIIEQQKSGHQKPSGIYSTQVDNKHPA